MEALKFAFNTLIIGALALPWMALLMRMYFPPATDRKSGHGALVSALPDHARDPVLSIVILALGYFLGVAITRTSDDFFGDEDLWSLPTEPSIREDVYYHEYCDANGVVAARTLPKPLDTSEVFFCPPQGVKPASSQKALKGADWHKTWGDAIMQFFRLQESKLLLQGDEKITRLRELHDQIVILRGATLNGMVLSTLCFFGFCASFQNGSRTWWSYALTHVGAIALVLYGVYAFWVHFQALNGDSDSFRDPPLAEGVMVLVGIAGLLGKAQVDSRWKYAHGCGLSFALTIVAYGSWWWTEVMYNQGIIHAYPTL